MEASDWMTQYCHYGRDVRVESRKEKDGNVGRTYGIGSPDGVDVVAGRVAGVAVDDILQRRLFPVNEDGARVDEPLDQVILRRSHTKGKLEFLGRLGRDCCLDIWHDVGLVVAAGGERDAVRGGVARSGANVSEDAADVRSVCVRSVTQTTTSPDTQPVVTDGLVSGDHDFVSLAYLFLLARF